jgi:hypothetical protein
MYQIIYILLSLSLGTWILLRRNYFMDYIENFQKNTLEARYGNYQRKLTHVFVFVVGIGMIFFGLREVYRLISG